MKVLFWRMKVFHCNFATSKNNQDTFNMKKFLSLILVVMVVTLPVIAQESSAIRVGDENDGEYMNKVLDIIQNASLDDQTKQLLRNAVIVGNASYQLWNVQ